MPKPDPALLERERYPVTLNLATRYQDLDPNHHVNNVAIAGLFEEMRVRFDHRLNMPEIWRESGLGAMIASVQIEYLGETFYPDPVVAHIGTLATGRSSWTIGAIATQGDAICAFMQGTMVCIRDKRPHPLPERLRAGLTANAIRLDRAAAD